VIEGIRGIQEMMEREQYVTDRAIATTAYLAMELKKPVLIEGQAGVGKTEIAKVLASALNTELIRLQCYEGLDVNTALYEWNYPKQMLRIKMEEHSRRDADEQESLIFSDPFLLKRPLLRAITAEDKPPVLLIDEVDRSDEEFEAFLLEVLSDFQVTIPEIGTITATHPPIIVLTSNRTRDLHDAVKRRCLYHWIDYPDARREVEIIRRRVKGAAEVLAVQVATAVSRMRDSDVQKPPGIAEAIDWLAALDLLGVDALDAATIDRTLGAVLKYGEDQEVIRAAGLEQLVQQG
jgi:MoxR-like ATPase